MSSRKLFRLRLTLYRGQEVSPDLCYVLGGIMHNAVFEPPWLYRTWPLGHKDVEPGTSTAVGYMKLCQLHNGHFFVLNHEDEDGNSRPVGVWAGLPVSPELIPVLHLDHGIDAAAVKVANQADVPLFGGRTYYHLIIAIDGHTGAEDRPLESHRGMMLRGKKAARVMVEHMPAVLAAEGFDHLVTKTHPKQEKMVGLFQRVGFVPIGQQVATHGASSAERTIFFCSPKKLPVPDNSGHLLSEWM